MPKASPKKASLLRLFCIAIISMPLAQTVVAQDIKPANFTLEPFVFEANDGQHVDADKGVLLVRENRSNPDSRMIPINFIRFRSTSDNPGSPIVYLAGGPGGSGISIAKRGLDAFAEFTAIADVIVFDQRGTGEGAMRCPDPIQLPVDRIVKYDEVLRIVATRSLICKKYWQDQGYDLDGYTTAQSAHDVDELRIALGYEKISLLGASYGSHYALAIMKLHESSVDKAIIAGVEGLDQTLKLPSNYDTHFDDINALIQEDPAFSTKIPDLPKMFRGILNRLEKNPAIVTIVDGKTGENVEVHVGKFDVQLQVWGASGRNSASAPVPAMIYKMDQGDFETVAQRTYQFKTRALRLSAMTVMMDGASGASKTRLADIAAEAEGSLFGNVVNFLFPELGAAWDAPDLGEEFRAPLCSALPVLIISGTMDARTPVTNGEEVAKCLPNSQHVIVTGVGHPPAFDDLKDEVFAFLKGEKLSNLKIEGPRVEFDSFD